MKNFILATIITFGFFVTMTSAKEAPNICMLMEGFGDESWLDDIKEYEKSGGDINAKCSEWSGIALIHQAAATRNITIMDWLMSKGADINSHADDGSTPLHEAVVAEIERYMSGQTNNLKLEVTKRLIEMGADKHARNNDGLSPYDLKDDYQEDTVDRAIEKVFRD